MERALAGAAAAGGQATLIVADGRTVMWSPTAAARRRAMSPDADAGLVERAVEELREVRVRADDDRRAVGHRADADGLGERGAVDSERHRRCRLDTLDRVPCAVVERRP